MFLKKLVLALVAFVVFGMSWHLGHLLDFSIGGLGVLSLSGLLAFLFAVAILLFTREGFARAPVPMDTSLLLFCVFVVVNFASIGWADRPNVAIISAINYAQFLIFVWLLAFLRSEKYAFSVLLHAYILGLACLATLVLIERGPSGLSEVDYRVHGFYDPNTIAYQFILSIPILVYLFQRSTLTGYRWLYLSLVPLSLTMVLLAGSRTGLVVLGFVLALQVWFFVSVEKANALRVSATRALLVAGALAIVTVLLFPILSHWLPAQFERFATLSDPMASGFGNRIHMWLAAIEVYLNNPLLGIGSGGGGTAILPYFEGGVFVFSFLNRPVSLHNVFLAVATGTGTVGILLFLSMIGSLVLRALSFAREERLLFLSLIGASMIMALTLGLEQVQDFYFVLFLPVALAIARYPATTRAKAGEAPPLVHMRRGRQQGVRPY